MSKIVRYFSFGEAACKLGHPASCVDCYHADRNCFDIDVDCSSGIFLEVDTEKPVELKRSTDYELVIDDRGPEWSPKPLDRQEGGSHYKQYAIQPAEFIQKNGLGWCEGNVVKYVCRHQWKNGKEDLLKAKHYIDMLLQMQYEDDGV